ncbi:DUF4890 domain-containing protein [Rufibacter tibetensis]|uniref:DUF4890 domain-containing protein n=1 Tax=Rufibacter tibetensis TaxID=512763 RepID=A0A0P0C4E9_9BACT|nr:DUF4890 domain-containing protein [Rufibacter tibetensis]ALJ00024.1 hypothetical protein DC20_14870 [Rufibacter tibetensis]
MKKYLVMMALGLAVAGTSYAQTTPQQRGKNPENRSEQRKNDKGEFHRGGEKRAQLSPEERATKRTEMLTQKLDLNSSQKRKLQAINLKHAQQMASFKGQKSQRNQLYGGEGNDQHRQQMQQLHASWEKEFKDIVSKKQYAQYEEERKQMQANRGNRKGREEGKDTRVRRQQNG